MNVFVDVSECAWCGETVVQVEQIGSIYLVRPKWIHKGTGEVLCLNGRSAAYPKDKCAL